MKQLAFKPRWLLIALTVLALGLGAVACEEEEKAPAPTPALRVALLLPGTIDDFGYNAMGKRALDAAKEQLGAEVAFTESVPVPTQADVYRRFASQGFDLVIGWGGQFTDGAVEVAKEFPNVRFFVVNSNVGNETNVGSFDTDVQDWQFVGGFVVANLSKSGVVGWVGGQCFPATAKNLHGTEQGAKFANANIRFLSTFTGDFEDPVKAQQAAQAMIEQGADVLTGNLNNGWFGVFEAARAAGIPVVTEWFDNHDQAPDVIASSILKDHSRFLVEIVRAAIEGNFPARFQLFGLPPDWGPAVSDTDLLPDETYNDALSVQDKIVAGEIDAKEDTNCP